MRTPFLFLIVILFNSSSASGWIPESLDIYGEKQLEPILRPQKELNDIESGRNPVSSPQMNDSLNVPKPDEENEDIFEFRQEHMKKIIEKNF